MVFLLLSPPNLTDCLLTQKEIRSENFSHPSPGYIPEFSPLLNTLGFGEAATFYHVTAKQVLQWAKDSVVIGSSLDLPRLNLSVTESLYIPIKKQLAFLRVQASTSERPELKKVFTGNCLMCRLFWASFLMSLKYNTTTTGK